MKTNYNYIKKRRYNYDSNISSSFGNFYLNKNNEETILWCTHKMIRSYPFKIAATA
jgi:hypothetical protein